MGGKRYPFALAEAKTVICALSLSELTQEVFRPLNGYELTNSLWHKGKNTLITDKYLAWLVGEVVLSFGFLKQIKVIINELPLPLAIAQA